MNNTKCLDLKRKQNKIENKQRTCSKMDECHKINWKEKKKKLHKYTILTPNKKIDLILFSFTLEWLNLISFAENFCNGVNKVDKKH